MRVRLAPGRERAVHQGHPWIFSGAVGSIEPATASGEAGLAVVESAVGERLGEAFWSPASQIRLRIATGPAESIDRRFFRLRLERARALRASVVGPETTGYRWLNAEGDGVPAWTIDRFGDVLVSQVTCAGLEATRDLAYAALAELAPETSIQQSNDLPSRRLEGLRVEDEAIRGEPPALVEFRERGLRFTASLGSGQKTGFYFDQRENRRRVETLAAGARVLDLFAHTGAFGVAARRGGASAVTHVESSAAAIDRGREHYPLNGLDEGGVEWVKANVFEWLRGESGARYDLVVCDPPPLARRRSDVERAARAYKDLNRLAMGLVAPGGFLFTFTCSGAVDAKLFRQILHAAAVEARTEPRLLQPLGAAPDHPVSIHHPEGEYLRGWLLAF